MKIDIFNIPRAEMDIMNILWDTRVPADVPYISNILAERHGKSVKPQTIRTLCKRLARKRLITQFTGERANLYLPLIPKDAYRFYTAKLLIAELFGGSTAELMEVLFNDYDMSRCELEAIKTLVAQAEEAEAETECEDYTDVLEDGKRQRKDSSSPSPRRINRSMRRYCEVLAVRGMHAVKWAYTGRPAGYEPRAG